MNVLQNIRQSWASFWADFTPYVPVCLGVTNRPTVYFLKDLEGDDKVKFCQVDSIHHLRGRGPLPEDYIAIEFIIRSPQGGSCRGYIRIERHPETVGHKTALPIYCNTKGSESGYTIQFIRRPARSPNDSIIQVATFREPVPMRDFCRLLRAMLTVTPDQDTESQCRWFLRNISPAAQRKWDAKKSLGSLESSDEESLDRILRAYAEVPVIRSAKDAARDRRIQAEREQLDAEREQMRMMEELRAQVQQLTAQNQQLMAQLARTSH